MPHQSASVTNSLMAIVGSCLKTSSAVRLVMEECPSPREAGSSTQPIWPPPPQCSSGEGFPYHNHSLDSRTPHARGTGTGVECMDRVLPYKDGEEGPANFKLVSGRQQVGPNLSWPSLLTPEPPRARSRRLQSGLIDPTVAAACERVPGAFLPAYRALKSHCLQR